MEEARNLRLLTRNGAMKHTPIPSHYIGWLH